MTPRGARRTVRWIGAATIFIFFAAQVDGLASAATGSQVPAAPTRLVLRLPGHITGCDPVGSQISAESSQILSLVLPSAFTTTPEGQVAQADSFLVQAEVTNLSPLVVDYQILPNARWADGRSIGIDDFITTWHLGVTGDGPASNQYRLIRSISSEPGSNHVVVTFTRATSDWRELFSPLMPRAFSKIAAAGCRSPSAAIDVSGGPFKIITASPYRVRLDRNLSWWGTQPAFESVVVQSGPSTAANVTTSLRRVGMVQSGWLDSATLAGLSSAPGVSSRADLSSRLVSLDFSLRRAITRSVQVRSAIAHLIDRRSLVTSTVAAIDATVAPAGSHLLAQGQPGYSGPIAASPSATTSTSTTTATSPTAQDIAQRLLATQGIHKRGGRWLLRSGKQLNLTIGAPIDDRWAVELAAGIGAQLRTEGVASKIVILNSSQEVAAALRLGAIDSGVLVRQTSPFPTQATSWFTTLPGDHPSPLWTGVKDPELSRLAVQASEILNPVNAAPVYHQFDHRLWMTMPSLPILTEPWVIGWSTVIDGVSANPFLPGTLADLLTWKIQVPVGS